MPNREPIPKPAKFVWPPQSPPALSPGLPRPTTGQPPRPSRRAQAYGLIDPQTWWETIEETWLGVVSPTWERRCREADWQPEPVGLWCVRCGRSVGEFETEASGCAACRDQRVPWTGVVRLGTYEGVLREAILEIKHSGWRRLARDVGRELGCQVALAMATEGAGLLGVPAKASADTVVLLPVPMALRRRATRPLEHTMALTRGVRAGLGEAWGRAPRILQPLLRRFGPTQQSKSFDVRRRNVTGTMRAKWWFDGRQLDGKTVVLVDDVLTSGATLTEACRALMPGQKGRTLRIAGDAPKFSVVCAVAAVAGERG